MMDKLIDRAVEIARAKQRKRIERIASDLRDRGISPAVGSDSVSWRGAAAARKWLSDPLLRFAGRTGA